MSDTGRMQTLTQAYIGCIFENQEGGSDCSADIHQALSSPALLVFPGLAFGLALSALGLAAF